MTPPTQVILSWSGGKDSALALAALRADPHVEVVALLTSITAEYDRISIHGVRRALLETQAAAAGLPLIEIALRPASSNAEYEAAFLDALRRAGERFPRCRMIAFGDLFLEDVRTYRETLLAPTGWTPIFPIWGADTTTLARKFVDDGFEARLVCVDTTQLAGTFAGRAFDATLLGDLPRATDPCGERGEFHTFVWRGPVFARDIPIAVGDVVLRDDRFMYCDLLPGMSDSSIDVSTDIVIDRPADAVARFTTNPDNAPRWYATITSVRWRSPRPLQLGSHLAFVARFMGKRLEYTYEVAEYEPGLKLVMRTAQGSFPMETTYEFEPLGPAQCRMRLRNRGGPRGLAAIAAPLMSFAVRRENQKDLARLKELLER